MASANGNPPKRKRTRRKGKALPIGLAELADAAVQEHHERPCAPRILIEKTKDGWRFASPYAREHQQRWEALLFQAFGTRSGAIMTHFLDTFTKLVGHGEWDEDRQCWMPKQNDFDAMVAIVHSLQPENEAQAAYAAQLCALHLSAMKLGDRLSRHYEDPRTAAILSKTIRAYGDGMERLARLQGKVQPKTVNQTIEVHKHEHVHFEGGVSPNGAQPHAATRGATIQRPALSGPKPGGQAVPLPCSEGEARLPNAWWLARLWRSVWRAQR